MVSGNEHFNIVKLLVEQGATVDSRNNEQTNSDYCREWVSRHRALLDRDWRGRVCPGSRRVDTTSQCVDVWAPQHREVTAGVWGRSRSRRLERKWRDVIGFVIGRGMADVVCFLIEHGADTNVTDNISQRPLRVGQHALCNSLKLVLQLEMLGSERRLRRFTADRHCTGDRQIRWHRVTRRNYREKALQYCGRRIQASC